MTTSADEALFARPPQFLNAATPPFYDDQRATWHVFGHTGVKRVP
jgi:hypothetical protein